jgi:hypothetical protein
MAVTMLSLLAWLLAPAEWRLLPHPIYLTWTVSLASSCELSWGSGLSTQSWR